MSIENVSKDDIVETNFRRMVDNLAKPGVSILMDLTSQKAHILHMAVGIMGETIELKRALMNDDGTNLREECGDLEFYIVGAQYPSFLGFCLDQKDIPKPDVKYSFQMRHPCHQYSTYDLLVLADDMTLCAGDLLDDVKKWTIYDNPKNLCFVPIRLHHLLDMLNKIYRSIGVTRTQIKEANIEKLARRYPDGVFTCAHAIQRADKEPGVE